MDVQDKPGIWQFVLGPAQGGWKWSLANAKGRKANFKLIAPSAASFTMRGDDELAHHVDEYATDLHLLRRNRAGVVEQLYRGRIGTPEDELTGSGHSMAVPSLDYRGVLERRILASGSQVTWTTQDRFDIAWGLITQAQNKTGGDYGIARGVGTMGKTSTETWELGDSIGTTLQEFSQADTGFDWDIVPDGPSGLTWMAWPERGTDNGVILQWGGAAVESMKRTLPDDYANMVRVSGQPPEGSSTPPAIHEGLATGIADPLLFPQGRWDKAFGTNLTTTAAIASRRDWLLDYHQVVRPSYTVKLAAGFWDGPSHIWLGDPVRLVAVSGKRLRVDTVLRVSEIDISISDEGEESVSLSVGAPRPDFARRVAAIDKRLDQLGRR